MTESVPSQDSESVAQRRAWIASLLLRRQDTWFGRFTLQLQRLTALGRGQRRRLTRKAAVSLAGAALVLSLGAEMMPWFQARRISAAQPDRLAPAANAPVSDWWAGIREGRNHRSANSDR